MDVPWARLLRAVAVAVALQGCSSATIVADELPWIEVDPSWKTALRERGTGRPFVAVGLNYFGPHTGWAPKLWHRFEADQVEGHLRLIHEQGFNTLRVFLTLDSFHREPGQVHPAGLQRFRTFLDLCRRYELRVIPSGPDHWEGIPDWLRGRDRFADERVLAAMESWWERFAGHFRDEPVILAWDLLNEPSMGWRSEPMQAGWNRWLEQKYGSVQRIAAAHELPVERVGAIGSIAVPDPQQARGTARLLDYQRFRESIADAWTGRMAGAIRRADPKHLVTVGHVQWTGTAYLPSVRHYAGVNLRSNARLVDFVSVHFYPIAPPSPAKGPEGIARNAAYLEQLLAECSVGKPVMIGEFGWYGGGDVRRGDRVVMPSQTPEDQLRWNRKLLEVSRGRVCGWLNWAFADTPTSRDLTRWSGLWTADLELKPWGDAFAQFARGVRGRVEPFRPFPDPVRAGLPQRRAALTGADLPAK